MTARRLGTGEASTTVGDLFFNYLAQQYGLADDKSEVNARIIQALEATLFDKQLNVIKDPARWKSVLTPRRAGKSYMAMVYAHLVALSKNGAKVIIVNLTLKSGKNVFWGMIQKFHRDFGIEVDYHHTEMRITLRNGSLVQIVGADTRQEIEKLRGGSYDLIIIDECKSFSPALITELIQDVAKPALSDRRGSLVMIGTPGHIMSGPFYEATAPGYQSPELGKPASRTYDAPETYWEQNPDTLCQWSRHTWTIKHNVSTPHLLEEALIEKEREGWQDDHPTWLREYMGQWVPSESSYVYAYALLSISDPDLVTYKPNPDHRHGLPNIDGDWRYLLGMDLGFEDETALVVGAYNMNSRELYHVWDHKESHLDVYQVADLIESTQARFGQFDAMVADCANLGKMVVETYNKRHGMYIQAAEKREKNDFIELINADFKSGRIKIKQGSDLELELQNLQWDLSNGAKEYLAKTGKLKELASCANHETDCLLYLWRYSYHHYGTHYRRPQPTDVAGWWAAYEKRLTDKFDDEQRRKKDEALYEASSGASELDKVLLRNPRDPLSDYYKN